MIPEVKFGVHAPDQATFIQSWIDAGIWTAPHEYTPEYQGIFVNMDSWPGLIVKTPAVLDSEGNITTPAVMVPGWHTNALVYGQPLLAEFTHQLEQYDENGQLKSIWDRTWASAIFQLTWQEADPESGFPAGYRNAAGITYADARAFSSPSNIIAT